jgi:hypothetical protein
MTPMGSMIEMADPQRGYRMRLDADERTFLGLVRPAPAWLGAEPPDWKVVSELGRIHQMQPRLHRAVERGIPPEPPPEAFTDRWRKAYYSSLGANLPLLDQRDRLVKALAEAGVTPMVVKGAAVADALHEDPALRPMDDVDLLLPPGGEALLASLRPGLEREGVDWRRLEAEERHHDLTMDGTFRVDFDRLWAEAGPAPFAGGAARLPALEDQLLLVCVSCCRNSFWKLVTLLDAAVLLHRHGGEIDWDVIVDRSRRWELAVALDTLLALCAMLFEVAAPDTVRARLAPGAGRRRIIADLLAAYRLHAGGGLESVNIPRPIRAFALKYAVSTPRVLSRQARAVLLPGWRWMRAHYPEARRGELLLRTVAHPFVVVGLAARLALRRGR